MYKFILVLIACILAASKFSEASYFGGLGIGLDNLYLTAPALYGPYDALAYGGTLGTYGQHDLASFPHFTTYGSVLRSGLAAQSADTVALNAFAANGVGLYGLNAEPFYGYGGYGGYGYGYPIYDPLDEVYSAGIGKAFGNAANIAGINIASAGLGPLV